MWDWRIVNMMRWKKFHQRISIPSLLPNVNQGGGRQQRKIRSGQFSVLDTPWYSRDPGMDPDLRLTTEIRRWDQMGSVLCF